MARYNRDKPFDERRWKQDRHSAHTWAKWVLSAPEQTIILDTETTDFDGEVVELAIINLNGVVLYNGRFKPQLPINPEAERVHGLSADVLKNEPDFADEFPKIKAVIEAANLTVIYNAEFDVQILNNTRRARQLPAFGCVSDCAMKKYAQYKGRWNAKRGDYQWQKLPSGDHSALGDCRATLDIIRGMAAKP